MSTNRAILLASLGGLGLLLTACSADGDTGVNAGLPAAVRAPAAFSDALGYLNANAQAYALAHGQPDEYAQAYASAHAHAYTQGYTDRDDDGIADGYPDGCTAPCTNPN